MADWRDELVTRVRTLIEEADPDAVEEAKWKKKTNPDGVPTWNHDGIICTCETYKDKVKLTFASGAKLDDPDGLFNSGLESKQRRVIDLHEGDTLDAKAFKALVKRAAKHNAA